MMFLIPEEGHFPIYLKMCSLCFTWIEIVFIILSRFFLCLSYVICLSVPQRCIINNTHRLVELCVAKLSQDWFPLLELLAMATNPHCKFHVYNGTRPSETVPAGAQLADDELSARPPDPRSPKVKNHCNFLLTKIVNLKLPQTLRLIINFLSFLVFHSLGNVFLKLTVLLFHYVLWSYTL